MRALGMEPVHDTREVFQSVMNAMSRPGTVHSVSTAPADHAVLATLADHEVTLYSRDEQICDALAAEGRLTEAPLTDADVVHVTSESDIDLGVAKRGTRKEPGVGATVVYRVRSFSGPNETSPTANGKTAVAVAGPGVDGTHTIDVGGLSTTELEAIREAQADYPRGIDLVLTSDTRVAALPRSVELEVA
jgi:alpha-D-ribose 1-methylphosphonate 5-triphosphate synthase subunit PhnH